MFRLQLCFTDTWVIKPSTPAEMNNSSVCDDKVITRPRVSHLSLLQSGDRGALDGGEPHFLLPLRLICLDLYSMCSFFLLLGCKVITTL